MYIKKTALYLVIFLFLCIIVYIASWWWPPARYADPFYNVNYNHYPYVYLPLVKPIRADPDDDILTWRVFLRDGIDIWVRIPKQDNSLEFYAYNIKELEKFAVENGVIIAYSAYVDTEADAYIQDNYYHWFVLIPDKKIAEGFHTEEEFNQHIQTLGIQNPDWQTPDEAYKQFTRTGCLEWMPSPDCK
ncbi:MAG: hypothetical protein KA473_16995 [Anaerolineales bacterium]|nr:hypothetical protein [Anaerolineales bacterium]MBP6211131.1 hypothetical protein [Anaerolineales bacterium]